MDSIDFSSILRTLVIVLFIVFVLVAFVVSTVYQIRHRKKHKTDLQALAARHGWQFYETFDFPFLRELAHYTGKNEKGVFGETLGNPLIVKPKNVIQGNMHGRSFAVFEQTYRTGHERTYDVSQTLFAVEVRDMNLPLFCLEPDSFEKFLSFNFKRLDIDFHTHPNFSRQYLLYGQDERTIRNLFQPPVLAFYEQYPLFTTVAGGKYLVIYQGGHVCEPNEIVERLNFLFALVNKFKNGR